MKKIITFFFSLSLLSFLACTPDNNTNLKPVNITFNFSHNWDGTPVTNTDFNAIKYINANEDILSITKLRYLISHITLTTTNGEKLVLNGYNLVDVTNNTNLSFTPLNSIPKGSYSNVSFTFGFNNDANYNGNYPDLNSTSWNVPATLGGGYHYMQLEGKFKDNTSAEVGYDYHVIRAVDNSVNPLIFEDTFFEVNLSKVTISNNTVFNIEMNIAEWFKTPNKWDLNILNNMLMPNFNAQVKMFENGQDVFSLKSVTP